MQLVSTVTLASPASSIAFTSIPQDATDLVVALSLRSANAVNVEALLMQTSVTSNVYTERYLRGTGSSADSGVNSSNPNANLSFTVPGSNFTANTFGNMSIYFPNYTSAQNKSYSLDVVTENNATLSVQLLYAGTIASTTTISQLTFYLGSGNFVAGSTASLYKITKA